MPYLIIEIVEGITLFLYENRIKDGSRPPKYETSHDIADARLLMDKKEVDEFLENYPKTDNFETITLKEAFERYPKGEIGWGTSEKKATRFYRSRSHNEYIDKMSKYCND